LLGGICLKKIVAIIIILFLCSNYAYADGKSTIYSIYINAASRTLKLFNNEVLIKEYPIAVGKPATKSPIGNFTIRNKAVNPYWNNKGNSVAPGPKNPLGIRWLGISAPRGTYGIHGNNVPSSIGTFASGGCIRMYNNDVEELYSMINISTKVQIAYDTIELKQDKYSNSTALIVYPDVYKQKNAEGIIKKMIESKQSITQEQAAKALKLASANILNPIAVCDGTAVLLNDQYITNDAFIEDNQIYIYYAAAVDSLGIDGDTITTLSIPVIEKNKKVYINLTKAAAKIGGQIKTDVNHNNVYIRTSIVKVNGKYLCTYIGSFDKDYLLDSSVIKQIGLYNADNSKKAVSLSELCKQKDLKFFANSINKVIDIKAPLRIKVGDMYISTEFYNGRYYINSDSAANIPSIKGQKLNIYSYKDKNYYDVYEIMDIYKCRQDNYFTTIEVIELLNSNV
jgi:L,D-transpeptidase ErfK/SrfK